MDLDSAAYCHDHELLNQLLSDGALPSANTLCGLVLYDSKSVNLQLQNLEVARRFIEMGVDPNELPSDGHAPAIDLAAASPNPAVLKLLLESGATPTPSSTVHCAIGEDLDENLQLLIDHGVDMQTPMDNVDPDDDFAPVPLDYAKAIKARKCQKLLRLLLK